MTALTPATPPAAAASAPVTGPTDATALYARAVQTMQTLPQPPFATFTSGFIGDHTGFAVERTATGGVRFSISTAGTSPGPIATAYRGSDRLAAVTLPEGIGQTHSALADPTWAGAAAFARYGVDGPPPTTAATAAPQPADTLHVIGSVNVFAIAFYRVSDAGAATCPSGTGAQRLHLIAVADSNTHPLTDVIVESSTQRICSVRFKLHVNGPIAYAPIVELHFEAMQQYYLSTGGFIDGEIHVFGLGVKHTYVRIERSGFTFPTVMPEALAGT